MRKLKILITGVGSSGKSTLRRKLKELFPESISVDLDRDKIPSFQPDLLYFIEDVRATTKASLSLEKFDLIVYVVPDRISHFLFWFSRFWSWFKYGKGCWRRERGWIGNGKKYNLRNLPVFIPELFSNFRNCRRWIKEDLNILDPLRDRIIFIYSSWGCRGIKFSLLQNLRQQAD